MDSLSDRLKALGFVPAAKIEKSVPIADSKSFEAVLEPIKIENQFGILHLVEKQFPSDYQHGNISFRTSAEITQLSTAARVQTEENTQLSRLLFLDTETTGLSGGTGTLAFLVGLGYFTEDGFRLRQYVLKDPTDESAMLLDMLNFCEHFTGIVTYNGKGFDIPLLRSRLVLNRLPNPFESLAHFDLLYLARRIWRNRLPSRSLQDLEHEILNIPRSEDEVPGWMIPEIYFDYLRKGDATPLKGVVYHNGMDILSLAALFLYLSDSFENIQESSQFNPVDYYSMGQLYMDLGFKEVAMRIFNECDLQGQLPAHLQIALLQRMGAIHKSQQHFDQAILYWQKAAIFEDIDSSIELAKYYEHTEANYTAALFWTETAIAFLTKRGYHTYQSRSLAKELLKRKDRLSQKKERKNGNVSEKIG